MNIFYALSGQQTRLSQTDTQNIGKRYIPHMNDCDEWNTTLSLYSQIEKLSIGRAILHQVPIYVNANYLDFDNKVVVTRPLNFNGSSNNPQMTLAEIFNEILNKKHYSNFAVIQNLFILNEQLNIFLETVTNIEKNMEKFQIENEIHVIKHQKVFNLVQETVKTIHWVFSHKLVNLNKPINENNDDLFNKERKMIVEIQKLMKPLVKVFPKFQNMLETPISLREVEKLHYNLMLVTNEINELKDVKNEYQDFQVFDLSSSSMKKIISAIKKVEQLQETMQKEMETQQCIQKCHAKNIDELLKYQYKLEQEVVNCFIV